ncbi:uncharacterized protein LOC116045085 [Sander lucioperca]|uniref:uncharacterized protein LOC116045085 n=1 Tax=Sander lucioperca TaxID=283035 RepID=UPI0016538BAD|nr:uncharacterized protein LOC116045085 [Sander lucioperca]
MSSKEATVFLDSTDTVNSFALHFKASSSAATPTTKDPIIVLLKKVQDLFNQRYKEAGGTGRLPYQSLVNNSATIKVAGLPTGLDIKKPSFYGRNQLEAILAAAEQISFEINTAQCNPNDMAQGMSERMDAEEYKNARPCTGHHGPIPVHDVLYGDVNGQGQVQRSYRRPRCECSPWRSEVSRQCRSISLWREREAAVCPSNRLIHWCTSGDSVQLVEQSLDTNLLNNAVRLRLSHCSVLPGGVHIQETLNNVVILVSTNRSVHRLLLPHPSRMSRSDLVTELHMQSIFTDVGKLTLQDAAHSAVIPGSLSPSTSTAWLSQSGETHYALAAPAGGIVVLSLPPHGTQGSMSVVELKRSSRMPTAIRGDQSPSDRALSLAVGELEEDCFIFALCQDHKLRMWSFREQACVLEADMLAYMPACKGVKRNPGNGHRLRLAFSPNTGLCLCVYFAVPQRGQFTVLQLVAADNRRYSLEHISSLFTTQETLVDFSLTPTDIWGVWANESNAFVVKYINFEDQKKPSAAEARPYPNISPTKLDQCDKEEGVLMMKMSVPDESNTPLVRRSKRLAAKRLQNGCGPFTQPELPKRHLRHGARRHEDSRCGQGNTLQCPYCETPDSTTERQEAQLIVLAVAGQV